MDKGIESSLACTHRSPVFIYLLIVYNIKDSQSSLEGFLHSFIPSPYNIKRE